MKKILCFLAASLLLSALCGVWVYAEEGNEDLTGGVVTKFGYERAFRLYENQTSVYGKDDLTELYDLLTDLDDFLQCSVQLPNDEVISSTCSVAWNIAELSLDKAGNYEVIGTLIPPQGCTFGQEVRTKIVLPVQISETDEAAEIVSIDDWKLYALAVAVPQGSSLEDITENSLFDDYTWKALNCKDEYGKSHHADINWDFSSLNLNKLGLYTIVGTYVAPEGTVFAEQLTLPKPTATISVQTVGKPDINCFYLLYPNISFPWVAPEGKLDSVTVWLSEDEAAWTELTAVEEAWVTEQEVSIALNLFTGGKTYRVQVDYEGGQTGILSFTWDDTIKMNGYWNGDRDGGDSSGGSGTLPPGITPNPDGTPDQTPDQTPGQMPDETPGQPPDQTPDQTPGQTPDEPSGQTPDQTPGQPPNQIPDQPPNQTPDQTPNQPPNQAPDQTQNATPNQTSNQASDQTPGQTASPSRASVGQQAEASSVSSVSQGEAGNSGTAKNNQTKTTKSSTAQSVNESKALEATAESPAEKRSAESEGTKQSKEENVSKVSQTPSMVLSAMVICIFAAAGTILLLKRGAHK